MLIRDIVWPLLMKRGFGVEMDESKMGNWANSTPQWQIKHETINVDNTPEAANRSSRIPSDFLLDLEAKKTTSYLNMRPHKCRLEFPLD